MTLDAWVTSFYCCYYEEPWLTLDIPIVVSVTGAFLVGLYLVLRDLPQSKKQSSR